MISDIPSNIDPNSPCLCLSLSEIYSCFSRYVSCVVGCPYEGKINPKKVAEVSIFLCKLQTSRPIYLNFVKIFSIKFLI